MSTKRDPREIMWATEALVHDDRNEKRRQAIGRAAFDEAIGLGGRLAKLVPCELCGLLDNQSPCGDHDPRGSLDG